MLLIDGVRAVLLTDPRYSGQAPAEVGPAAEIEIEPVNLWDRLYQVLDLEVERRGDGKEVTLQGVSRGIDLHDVSFRYGSRANVLEKVNLRIPAGSAYRPCLRASRWAWLRAIFGRKPA